VRTVSIAHQVSSGKYLVGDIEAVLSSALLRKLKGTVNLILTSPPFPLNHKKSYGNLSGEEYLAWVERIAPKLASLLAPDGSIVIEIGNSWEPQRPVQSLLHLKALMAFVEAPDAELRLCQQFICYNPSRLPSPAQWVTVERARVTDSFTHVWWMARTDSPKADNKKVLRPYGDDMRKLLSTRKYNGGHRPSEHYINPESFLRNNGGSIAHNFFEMTPLDENRAVRLPNVFSFSNNASNDHYSRACKKKNITPHPARMPAGLASFFIEFLTDPGDLVLDPFAGSNTTGEIAASLGRRWVAIDAEPEYAKHSEIRLSPNKTGKRKVGRKTRGKAKHEHQHRRKTHGGRSLRT
jgi:DNA modification methylase